MYSGFPLKDCGNDDSKIRLFVQRLGLFIIDVSNVALYLKKSDSVVFLVLSVHYDPFIATANLRKGAYNDMSKRDWKIFRESIILGNAYWTLACYMGITLFEWGWEY
ncbi:MAG: hypothetical protein A2Y66_08085 [Nitrospirae bacterium RBG_13_41_22]|nr:MAG: hypothetical protein A2Y66_08085 [Nitrospirae bacterium RBG_13_41_22]